MMDSAASSAAGVRNPSQIGLFSATTMPLPKGEEEHSRLGGLVPPGSGGMELDAAGHSTIAPARRLRQRRPDEFDLPIVALGFVCGRSRRHRA
jgi:hypothetical protein